ncbi:MAG: exodeoxyribonuclease III [Deltaproteobacteria bacterium]|nr:exodeoxyribonuclease III [Deltaproteobacteria bacterium]
MRVATWNVNSVRARLPRLLAWLEATRPDVLCLQEIKVETAKFPAETLAAAGYHAAVNGQRTYHGVAILSREPALDVAAGLRDGGDDAQARLVSARIGGVRVLSAYVPNGGEVGSEKFAFKLAWLERLRAHLAATASAQEPLVLCGDLNVAPEDRDVAHPEAWADTVLCHADVRTALRRVMDWGLVDTFRLHHVDGGFYSWWDYRQLAFPRNDGLRIDHILATAPLAKRCTAASIDREARKGAQPSDHVPVLAEFAT